MIIPIVAAIFAVVVVLASMKVSGECSRQEEKEWEDGTL